MKKSEKVSCQGLKKGPARKVKPPFSRGGPKRGNPKTATSTITDWRKGDPQDYVAKKTTDSATVASHPLNIPSPNK